MKALKSVARPGGVDVPPKQHIGYADGVVDRLGVVRVMLSVLMLLDDESAEALTSWEREEYLNHVRDLVDQAREDGEKLRYIARRELDTAERAKEAANG